MAVFNPYANVVTNKVSKLSFPLSACNYVYRSDTAGTLTGVLYNINALDFSKIRDILKGNPGVTISKGDKVYILPGHPLPQARIKEYFKTIGATICKNIDKATVIAGNASLVEDVECNTEQPKVSSLMLNADEFVEVYPHVPNDISNTFYQLEGYGPTLKMDYDKGIPCVVSKKIYKHIGWDANMMLTRDRKFITPVCADIIYNILARDLKVVTEEVLADSANSGLKLEDATTYESIYTMLNSEDRNSRNLGINILVHCDLSGDVEYNVWRLSRKFDKVIRRSDHNKGLSYFKQRSRWDSLSYKTPDEYLMYAQKRGTLNQKVLDEQLPKLIKNLTHRIPVVNTNIASENEDYFFDYVDNGDLSFTIKVKDEWRKPIKIETDGLTEI